MKITLIQSYVMVVMLLKVGYIPFFPPIEWLWTLLHLFCHYILKLCLFSMPVQLSDPAHHDEMCRGEQRCWQTNQSVHFTDWSHCQHGRSSHFPVRCGCVYCPAQQCWPQRRPDLHNPVSAHPYEVFLESAGVFIDTVNIPVSPVNIPVSTCALYLNKAEMFCLI